MALFGPVERDQGSRQLVMRSPQYEVLDDDGTPSVHTGRIAPVYEKLGTLTAKPLRRILTGLAEKVPPDLDDPLPPEVRGASA